MILNGHFEKLTDSSRQQSGAIRRHSLFRVNNEFWELCIQQIFGKLSISLKYIDINNL